MRALSYLESSRFSNSSQIYCVFLFHCSCGKCMPLILVFFVEKKTFSHLSYVLAFVFFFFAISLFRKRQCKFEVGNAVFRKSMIYHMIDIIGH